MEKEILDERVEHVRNYLCGYRFCADMLQVRNLEHRGSREFEEPYDFRELMMGDEVLWRSRMYEIGALVDEMKNGREKLILYYHYIRGLSIERAANLLGISRRTGYRWHKKGLHAFAELYQKKKKTEG